jgi:hypothetical protein
MGAALLVRFRSPSSYSPRPVREVIQRTILNTDDFPPDVLRPFGVVAVVPDTFVYQIMESGIVVSTAADHRASLTRPPLSAAEYLDHLRRNGLPGVAAALADEPI